MEKIKQFLQDYKPLLVVVIFCVLMAGGQSTLRPDGPSGDAYPFSILFMAYFFIFLSMFKFFDIPGFVEGFRTYDLIAPRVPIYGYLYPFIELGLGMGYLVGGSKPGLNFVTLVVMTVAGLGVINGILMSGKKIKCACLGTALNVPLGAISIVENFGMGGMALYHLL